MVTTPGGDCPEPTPNGGNRGYFGISPPSTPHASSVYWGPQSCCCGDTAGSAALDLLLAYILVKKAANPQIIKAQKKNTGGCEAVVIDWDFASGAPSPQTNLDVPDILLYFLAVLAAL